MKVEGNNRTVRNVSLGKRVRLFAIFSLFFVLYISELPKLLVQKLRSANLTSVSVTMSTSRLSFKGLLATGNTVGSSLLTIQTSGAPSVSTTNLFTDDTLWIGNGTTGSTYTVDDIYDSDQIQLTAGVGSGDSDSGDLVIASRSANLTVRFTTVSAVPNGAFRVLVPGVDNTANSNDGIPDHTGFDFGGVAAGSVTVTCPNDVSSQYDFVTGTATATAVTISSTTYHAYTCRYSGTGNVGEAFNGASDQIVINNVINPAPTNSHAEGTADQYKIIIQNLDGTTAGDNTIDSTSVAVATIESVRVTATVDPTLQFSIAGVATSTSACGTTTDVATTATGGNTLPNVPLGTVAISSFTEAAQTLTVSTNATGGYSVTALENDQLGKNGAACVDGGTDGWGAGNGCIPDVTGGSESGTGLNWNSTNTKGFGYSLEDSDSDVGTSDMEFYYSSGTSSCGGTGTFCARKYPDNQNSESAQRMFFSSTVADAEDVTVCYRIVVGATQEAGDYENDITYTATATF